MRVREIECVCEREERETGRVKVLIGERESVCE